MKIKLYLFIIITASKLAAQDLNLDKKIVLGGLSFAGKTPIAWLKDTEGQERWCREGDLFSEYKIKSIDPKFDQVIVVYKTGSEHTLRLKNTPISEAKNKLSKKLIAADQLNWPWIKSEANPMKRTAEVLPDWVLKNWDSLSDDVKTDFRNKYRQHGWDFTVTVVTPDRVRVSNTRLIDPNIPPLTDEQLRQKVESSVPSSGLNRTKK